MFCPNAGETQSYAALHGIAMQKRGKERKHGRITDREAPTDLNMSPEFLYFMGLRGSGGESGVHIRKPLVAVITTMRGTRRLSPLRGVAR